VGSVLLRQFYMSIAAASLALGSVASAGQIEELPTGWRLQNYVGTHNVVLYYTGASDCTAGQMNGTGMSQDDFDRLWSLVLTAKATGRPVGLYYDTNGGACVITSFYGY
jgi:hypothetical protein